MSIFDYGCYIEEHFNSNNSVADTEVGSYNWDIDILSSGADTLSYETDEGESFLRFTGGGSGAGDGTSLALEPDSVSVNQYGGYIRTRVRIPDIASNTLANNLFRIGFTDVVSSGEPVVGLWIDCAAGVMSFDSASANGDVSTAFSAPSLTSNTTLVIGTIYNIELVWSGNNSNADPGPDTLVCYINGELAGKQDGTVLLDSAETMEPTIVHWTDASATLELDVFGFEAATYLLK